MAIISRLLQSDVIPNFSSSVSGAISSLADSKNVDENEFIDACRLVYDGVRDIRRAVLLNREEEDVDSDTEWEEVGDVSEVGSVRPQVESRTDSMIDEYPDISGQFYLKSRNCLQRLNEVSNCNDSCHSLRVVEINFLIGAEPVNLNRGCHQNLFESILNRISDTFKL